MNKMLTPAKNRAGVATLVGALLLFLVAEVAPGTASARSGQEQKPMTTQNRFYCNSQALTAWERIRHGAETARLLLVRKAVVEMEKGYELQFDPETVPVAELAEWVTLESRCCPFFDFHIDLENEGKLVCLRLTGPEGIKPFIRAEFRLPRALQQWR